MRIKNINCYHLDVPSNHDISKTVWVSVNQHETRRGKVHTCGATVCAVSHGKSFSGCDNLGYKHTTIVYFMLSGYRVISFLKLV